eukprot:INCI16251.3.p1 GENE.INCI16251.3~~INCI16251.3.p1  ORF type:complete len:494 (-),score=67.93 INCI16251.3:344-1825(-)
MASRKLTLSVLVVFFVAVFWRRCQSATTFNFTFPECRSVASTGWPKNGSAAEKMLASNCGALYYSSLLSAPNGVVTEPIRVALLGAAWSEPHQDVLYASGCPSGPGQCPGYPNCEFFIMDAAHTNTSTLLASGANVAIFDTVPFEFKQRNSVAGPSLQALKVARETLGGSSTNLTILGQRVTNRPFTSIFYWREAVWKLAKDAQRESFDLEMGIHFWSDILNPSFVVRPQDLLQASAEFFLPFEERTGFAASIISHCGARSLRDAYVNHLSDALGTGRVHQYGACGSLSNMTGLGLKGARKALAKYMFYFAFENSIEPGYVTEKLFESLEPGAIPVYLGAPDVPKITARKSFINAMDFESPEALAKYLLYLAANKTAYMEYHTWRAGGDDAFNAQYLKLASRQLPGFWHWPNDFHTRRQQTCCRVCDSKFLELAKKRTDRHPLAQRIAEPLWDAQRVAEALGLPRSDIENLDDMGSQQQHLKPDYSQQQRDRV